LRASQIDIMDSAELCKQQQNLLTEGVVHMLKLLALAY